MEILLRLKIYSRALMVIGCLIICSSCKTHQKTEQHFSYDKDLNIDQFRQSYDSLSKKGRWHIILYDPTLPIDTSTHRPPIKAEIFHDEEIDEVQTVVEADTARVVEHQEEDKSKEKDVEPEIKPVRSFKYGVRVGVALVVLMLVAWYRRKNILSFIKK